MMMTLKQCRCTKNQIEIAHRYNCSTAEELLQLYPFRYEENRVIPFQDWEEKQRVLFEGVVVSYPSTVRYRGNRSITKFQIETQDSYLNASLFNRPWTTNLKVGERFTFIARYEGQDRVSIIQYTNQPIQQQLGIQCVYSLKEGIQMRSIKTLVRKVFESSYTQLITLIPNEFIEKYRLLSKAKAIQYIHFPKSWDEINQARRTLKYEEFLLFYLAIEMSRRQNHSITLGNKKHFNNQDVFDLIDKLPFDCTPDQLSAIQDVLEDMKKDQVMYRLIQGDVGCGKTIVAYFSMVACALSKKQSAMMAPTEILAKQHYQSFLELSQGSNLCVELIYSSLPAAKRADILSRLKAGSVDILIGTHAIIQDSVVFYDLGLVIADEQHRFGVEQRKKLKEKGQKVDFILMSATPIPRTLANTVYGDMEVSTIKTMPKNRKPVTTKLIEENNFNRIRNEIIEKLKQREQLYVVCAAIEESDTFQAQDVMSVAKKFEEEFNQYAKVAVLHGKMDNKDEIMRKFEGNEIQILIATTVVEVGVNVVNATTMVIYDAHRFGLSSLHQLRGRVQRGSKAGTCFLLTDTKEVQSLDRLRFLENTSDGFEISLYDLKLRGPGDLLGIRQSGLPGFVLGNIFEDTRIIDTARSDAKQIILNENLKDNHAIVAHVIKMNQHQVGYID